MSECETSRTNIEARKLLINGKIYSISTIDNKEGPVTLKTKCRIGSHSVIMPNVIVGENSIVGAFSFVIQNVPANVVAFGVPAKVIKKLGAPLNEDSSV